MTRKKLNPEWQNRIVGYGEMTADELEANPQNPRIHDRTQQAAMRSMLDRVGSVAPVIVNKATGRLVDGHMRAQLAAARGPVPVAYVELSDAEEAEALAMMDPIGAMAQTDADMLAALTADLTLDDALTAAIDGLVPSEPDEKPKPPDTVELRPFQHAYVLVKVPVDQWDDVADILDTLADIDGVDVTSAVN